MLTNIIFLISVYFLFNLLIKSSLTKNAVLVALYMVGSFISAGLIYLVIDFSLLGVMLILVYVGAVVVLFVFVSIMLPLRLSFYKSSNIFILLNYFIWFVILISLISNVLENYTIFNFFEVRYDMLQLFGLLLYTQKASYFLIAALLLTIAIIGAILLTQNNLVNFKTKEIINLQLNKNYSSDILMYS